MRGRLLLIFALIFAGHGVAQTQPTNTRDFRCNYAKVSRLLPKHSLSVRSRPGENSPVIAHLRLGQPIRVPRIDGVAASVLGQI
jgi:hypothetical protein